MFYLCLVACRDQRPANVAYYRRNRASEIARVQVRQRGTVELLRGLRERPCMDCGGSFEPHQMDFDHRDDATKSFRLTSGDALLRPTAVILDEASQMRCGVRELPPDPDVAAPSGATTLPPLGRRATWIGSGRTGVDRRRSWIDVEPCRVPIAASATPRARWTSTIAIPARSGLPSPG